MEKLKGFITGNKKVIIPVAVILVLVVAVGIYFATQPSNKDNEPKQEEKIEQKEKIETEVKLEEIKPLEEKGVIKGVKDYKVEKDTDINLKDLVSIDDSIVESVKIDDSKVDYSKEGEYEVIYTITFKGNHLNEFLEKNKDVKLTFDTNADTIIVKVKVTVEVISKEEAKAETEKGNTDIVTNETKDKMIEDNKNEVNTSTSSNNSTNNSNPNTSNSNNGNNNNSNVSNNNGNSSDNNGSTNEPPKESAHTHHWVDHTIQVPHEEQYIVREWDEPTYETAYVCPYCGYTGGITDLGRHISSNHADQVRENGGGTAQKTQVQTGSEHKIEYGTRTTYTTEVDYQYCDGCGQHK